MGRHFVHALARATVLRGSHQAIGTERFIPRDLKGDTVLVYPLKAFGERAATEKILCSERAWGRCPQQADGRKCECVLTLALLACI